MEILYDQEIYEFKCPAQTRERERDQNTEGGHERYGVGSAVTREDNNLH